MCVNKQLLVHRMPVNKSVNFSTSIYTSFQIPVGFFFFFFFWCFEKISVSIDVHTASPGGPDAYTRHIICAPVFSLRLGEALRRPRHTFLSVASSAKCGRCSLRPSAVLLTQKCQLPPLCSEHTGREIHVFSLLAQNVQYVCRCQPNVGDAGRERFEATRVCTAKIL